MPTKTKNNFLAKIMFKHLIFTFLLTVLSIISYAQQCGTPAFQALLENSSAEYRNNTIITNKIITEHAQRKSLARINASEEIYRIPVVVHIIHNNANNIIGGAKNSNISDEQIYSAIRVLNEDYRKTPGTNGYNNSSIGADTKIEFCLASRDPDGNLTNGIVRKYSNQKYWDYQVDDAKLKKISYWPADQYLNIWVTTLGAKLLGYSTFPADTSRVIKGIDTQNSDIHLDGVVIHYENFGTIGTLKPLYNLSRTATHEIGHFLGLRHIWGDEECGTDYVDDTPIDKRENDSGTCSDSSNCKNKLIYTPDMTNNYMDYSPDKCMNIFTVGQKNRMRTALEIIPRRARLLNSPGCCGSGQLTLVPFLEDFELTKQEFTLYNPGLNDFGKYNLGALGNSNYSFRFVPEGIFSGDTSESKNFGMLNSPYIDFRNIASPYLSFDLAYSPSSTGIYDSLIISYQINCAPWVTFKTYSGNDLFTATSIESNFAPNSNDWKTITMAIPELANKSIGRIRFEYYSKGANNLYLDNINIYESRQNIELSVYPNPTSKEINARIFINEINNIKAELFSALGELVYERYLPNTTSLTLPIDVSGLSAGVYFLRVNNGKNYVTTRVLVAR